MCAISAGVAACRWLYLSVYFWEELLGLDIVKGVNGFRMETGGRGEGDAMSTDRGAYSFIKLQRKLLCDLLFRRGCNFFQSLGAREKIDGGGRRDVSGRGALSRSFNICIRSADSDSKAAALKPRSKCGLFRLGTGHC